MKIAYWGCGYLVPNKIAADGGYQIRYSLIKELVKDGHEVHWINDVRDKEIPDTKCCYHSVITNPHYNSFFKEALKKTKNYTNPGTKTKDWYFAEVHGKRDDLPEVDALIMEINTMGLSRYNMVSILHKYSHAGVKCFLYDQDMWGKGTEKDLDNFNIKKENVWFLTPYSTKCFEQQIVLYYGYDKDCDLSYDYNAKKKYTHFVFIGNDYGKGKKMIKFYAGLPCHIYGKYVKDKEHIKPIIGEDKFLGPLEPQFVVPTLHEYLACIQVTQKKYEQVGLMTQRLNELANANTLCFIDGDIKDAEKFVPEGQVVYSSKEAFNKLVDYLNNGTEYFDRIQKQKEILPTFRQQIHKIYEVIK